MPKTTAPSFQGFADEQLEFWKALAKNQDREWFAKHKTDYEEGWAGPMAALLAEAREKLDSAYPHLELGEPKVFRIHRDVRFSADKSPYKTNVSGVITTKSRGKVTESPAALYIQLGTESFVGAGLYMMDSDQLSRYRAAVLEEERGSEIAKIVRGLSKKGFETGAAQSLKTAPKGIDPAHPRIELLKKKGLIVGFPKIPAGAIASRKLLDWVVTEAKRSAPLVTWLAFATA